jgi:hypothetical protein
LSNSTAFQKFNGAVSIANRRQITRSFIPIHDQQLLKAQSSADFPEAQDGTKSGKKSSRRQISYSLVINSLLHWRVESA